MVDRQRLAPHCLSVDDRHDIGEILVGIVYVTDFHLLSIDEHPEMLADQLDRAVRCGPIAGARCQGGIAAQRAQNPKGVKAGFFGRGSGAPLPSKSAPTFINSRN